MTTGRLGADPELFVVRRGSNKATSIHLLDTFTEFLTENPGNPVYAKAKADGFAFEFEITPSTCRDYLNPAFAAGIAEFYKRFPEYGLSAKASMELTKASTAGQVPVGVNDYGCVPDRNAYTLEEKVAPLEGYATRARFTGGHLHQTIGSFGVKGRTHPYYIPEGEVEERVAAYALFLDIILGVPFVAAIGHTNDYGEALRRTYYGQAGSHRVKEYGIEYRVLSGMLLSNPFLLTWAMGQMKFPHGMKDAILRGQSDYMAAVDKMFKTFELDSVRQIIDTHDVEGAREYWSKLKKELEAYGQYRPDFIDMMIEADKANVPINMNMREAWSVGKKVIHHEFPGIESLMRGNKRVTKTQFPIKDFVPKPMAKGWAR